MCPLTALLATPRGEVERRPDQPCRWSLDLSEAVARPHPPFRLYPQPNSWDPCWCHWRGPHILSSASSVFLPFVYIPHGPESPGWD